jgi:hypothetical protein
MTSRITDAKEDRLILALGFVESFLTPRKPIDGIMSVLQ